MGSRQCRVLCGVVGESDQPPPGLDTAGHLEAAMTDYKYVTSLLRGSDPLLACASPTHGLFALPLTRGPRSTWRAVGTRDGNRNWISIGSI